jgi:adenosylhomocysteine nucleosidase
MKLLLVAAEPREFQGLRPRLPQLGNHQFHLTANGAGPHHAAAAVDAALVSFRPDGIVSLGFCGALDPALAIADIVVGTNIFAGDRTFVAQTPASSAAHYPGAVCSLDHVARTAAEKSHLHAAGAIAVEMEAAGVAAKAQALGLPFFCIKAVTDLAGETLSNDFNAALRSDGHFDTIRILASSLQSPWVRLPELFRLRARCMRAARSLGDFIADCRF